jgi:hypothetical protein
VSYEVTCSGNLLVEQTVVLCESKAFGCLQRDLAAPGVCVFTRSEGTTLNLLVLVVGQPESDILGPLRFTDLVGLP